MFTRRSARVSYARRRFATLCLFALAVVASVVYSHVSFDAGDVPPEERAIVAQVERDDPDKIVKATDVLPTLVVRDTMERDGYARAQFGDGWREYGGCDMRNRILLRDLDEIVRGEDGCTVERGILRNDPYTATNIPFQRGRDTSGDIHIEHIVALSDAWQKGAQFLPPERRIEFANDPLNLIAVDGPANMQKGDSDASEWLPHESYHCPYVARQIAIKDRYDVWVTESEFRAMDRVLQTCPDQLLPIEHEVVAP